MHILDNTSILDTYELRGGKDVPLSQIIVWLEHAGRLAQGRKVIAATPLSAGAVHRVDSGVGPVVIKRKLEPWFKGMLAAAGLREPQLQRAFRLGQQARAAGLHTPEPLLYAERRLGAGIETVLVNRYEEGLQPWSLLQREPLASRMLESLGRELANWHAAGLRHRDLKGPNILFRPESGTGILLDLAGVHSVDGLPTASVRARDLGRLRSGAVGAGITPQQWQCLLDAYCAQSALHGCDLRSDAAFPGAIERFVRRKLQRYAKLKRPVF